MSGSFFDYLMHQSYIEFYFRSKSITLSSYLYIYLEIYAVKFGQIPKKLFSVCPEFQIGKFLWPFYRKTHRLGVF